MNTIRNQATAEYIEKKSKFISYLYPVFSECEAKKLIDEISEKHSDATHNVYAYSLTENGVLKAKCSDAGEPKNTAGRPVLELIKKLELTNVIIVISRYFGGIKLGAPGLARAYSKSAKLAIEKTEIIPYVKKISADIEFDYPVTNHVLRLISSLKDCEIIDRQFSDKVVFRISAAEEEIQELKANNMLKVRC